MSQNQIELMLNVQQKIKQCLRIAIGIVNIYSYFTSKQIQSMMIQRMNNQKLQLVTKMESSEMQAEEEHPLLFYNGQDGMVEPSRNNILKICGLDEHEDPFNSAINADQPNQASLEEDENNRMRDENIQLASNMFQVSVESPSLEPSNLIAGMLLDTPPSSENPNQLANRAKKRGDERKNIPKHSMKAVVRAFLSFPFEKMRTKIMVGFGITQSDCQADACQYFSKINKLNLPFKQLVSLLDYENELDPTIATYKKVLLTFYRFYMRHRFQLNVVMKGSKIVQKQAYLKCKNIFLHLPHLKKKGLDKKAKAKENRQRQAIERAPRESHQEMASNAEISAFFTF